MSNEIKKAYDGGSVLAKPQQTPSEEALSNLNQAIAEAHSTIETLIALAEPHLPRHLFDTVDDGSCCEKAEPSRVSGHSISVSRTVNGINSATNEVDRLTARISFLKNNLVT